jgi:hypothetical protein
VAVKMMPTDSVSKEMAKNFQDEVRLAIDPLYNRGKAFAVWQTFWGFFRCA